MSVSLSATNSTNSAPTTRSAAKSAAATATKVGVHDLQVRRFSYADIAPLLDFIFRGESESPLLRALDFNALPGEGSWLEFLRSTVESSKHGPLISLELHGRLIGVVALTDMQEGHADTWAAFFHSPSQGRGLGSIAWFKTCSYVFANLPTHTLYFRVPQGNPLAVGLVRKLPLNLVGEEEIRLFGVKPGLRGKVYSLTQTEFRQRAASLIDAMSAGSSMVGGAGVHTGPSSSAPLADEEAGDDDLDDDADDDLDEDPDL
jgi:RimJ/RimL family protein N-acetyltransferase